MPLTPTTKFKSGNDRIPCTASEPEITVVAHCLLNPNTRVKGLRPVEFRPGGPVIQLPCPEALYMGLDRWAVTRNQLDVPEFRRFCRSLISSLRRPSGDAGPAGEADQDRGTGGEPELRRRYYEHVATRAGACVSAEHEHVPGKGVFMEELIAELERRGVAFRAEEVGQKRLSESEFGSMPEIAPFPERRDRSA